MLYSVMLGSFRFMVVECEVHKIMGSILKDLAAQIISRNNFCYKVNIIHLIRAKSLEHK